jgi:hypothetical protein
MAKPKSTTKVLHVPGAPKKTRQGQGQHSLPKGTRTLSRGQGR